MGHVGEGRGSSALDAALIRDDPDTDQESVADTALIDEREVALQRFFALSPKEQLVVYRAMRDHLAARLRETKRDRVVEERAAAIAALEVVTGHLKLASGVAPTPTQFDAAARALDLRCERGRRWNRSRVGRAWGKWRFAKETFLGRGLPDSSDQRARRRAVAGRARTQEAALVAIRLWLATKPAKETVRDYETWSEEHNDVLKAGELPLPNATTIRKRIPITWPDILRFARDEISLEQGRPPREHVRRRHVHGDHNLVSAAGVREILTGPAREQVKHVLSKPSFPTPVVVLNRVRLWMRDDVIAYEEGRPFPERTENELRRIYLATPEVMKAVGLSRSGLEHGAYGIPSPAIKAGSINLWLRSEVEEWLKGRED